jgi:hypothetical protein
MKPLYFKGLGADGRYTFSEPRYFSVRFSFFLCLYFSF